MKHDCFHAADILLPDLTITDGTRWSAVACDQYTAQPDYWEAADAFVGDTPSTLRVILPEVYLKEADVRIPAIREAMVDYLDEILECHPDSMILVDRTLADGKHRLGLVGMIDLEDYDYRPGADTLIRATEETVPERIPPRTIIRRGAPMELPHVMMLIDDAQKTVIEPLFENADSLPVVYDFDLMQNSGHLKGYLLDTEKQAEVLAALSALATSEVMEQKYNRQGLAPLLFAVGDGNHSLAAAKTCYEELKARMGDAARVHPMRYALCEVVNLYDASLEFEPIYRVFFNIDPMRVAEDFKAYCADLKGDSAPQTVRLSHGNYDEAVTIPHPVSTLAVGTVQNFVNDCLADGRYGDAEVDYIHGEDVALTLGSGDGALAFLFDGMKKEELFPTVIFDGSLPRKTFSMGHASDKRFYTEARRLG
ncbi:MAG: DUF1015 domain-containing protein [Clostridia bacterium]|nr:DUF1015 domain-containing protein [Clostridia bacterium]